jgi:hypothetical protein
MDEFIQRVLEGPIDVLLSDSNYALLQAHLSIPKPLSDFTDPAKMADFNKLKAVRVYNRRMRERLGQQNREQHDNNLGVEFSLRTIDVPRLLGIVNLALTALEEYENWIGKYGHQSIATAELAFSGNIKNCKKTPTK